MTWGRKRLMPPVVSLGRAHGSVTHHPHKDIPDLPQPVDHRADSHSSLEQLPGRDLRLRPARLGPQTPACRTRPALRCRSRRTTPHGGLRRCAHPRGVPGARSAPGPWGLHSGGDGPDGEHARRATMTPPEQQDSCACDVLGPTASPVEISGDRPCDGGRTGRGTEARQQERSNEHAAERSRRRSR